MIFDDIPEYMRKTIMRQFNLRMHPINPLNPFRPKKAEAKYAEYMQTFDPIPPEHDQAM